LRLLHLTAGAAGMYCGSCLRDNSLAAALRARGHDVVLTPLYTPTNPDTPNVSSPRVFFGGISVYLEQHVPLFRHTPEFLDRIWDSGAALQLASKRQIRVAPATLGEMTVSMLRGVGGFQRKEMAKLLRWLRREPRFDSITLPNSLLIGLAKPLREALEVPVVCVLQGEDLFLDGIKEPWRSQALDLIRRAIDDVDVFIAVSDYYQAFMADFLRIPKARIRTVRLGIDFDGLQPAERRRTPPFTIGYFARLAPEKGLHILTDAYRRLREMPDVPSTRLLVGGYLLGEHRRYLEEITQRIDDWGLSGEFRCAIGPDRVGKIALLQEMDVFSVPTAYDEPKGLSVLEAMACGIPVVQPGRGAFPEIVARTGGGVLVAPDDTQAIAGALQDLLLDRQRAGALGHAAAEGVRRHYGVEQMATEAELVYQELCNSELGIKN
jgi:glycosyltransferase involved in cell wall biosynthesis